MQAPYPYSLGGLPMTGQELDALSLNTLRFLAVDAVREGQVGPSWTALALRPHLQSCTVSST